MSCARWITCPPLYSVEAIEASVEASVEASIEVASRLSVEAASRRRGQGSGALTNGAAAPTIRAALGAPWPSGNISSASCRSAASSACGRRRVGQVSWGASR